ALGLVPAGAGRAHEDLIATASCAVVDVPVVATSRFEAHVADRDAPCDERGQITPSDEVLREGLVGIAEREGLLELVLRHASLLRHRCRCRCRGGRWCCGRSTLAVERVHRGGPAARTPAGGTAFPP